jgi:outer membrane lipoprotein SlyB
MNEFTARNKTAIAVAIAFLLGVGVVGAAVMSGVIPRPARDTTPGPVAQTEPAPRPAPATSRKHRIERAPVVAAAPQTVTPPPCANCGIVASIDAVSEKGPSSGGGAVVGGLLGGLLGNQIGNGRGRDLATVAGVVGGALAGNEIEKNTHKVTRYRVAVLMPDGTRQDILVDTPPHLAIGERVKIVDGAPVPLS